MKLVFSSLAASDLEDTGGRWDPQDPAIRITIGKEKKETKRMKDAGVAASFPETFEFELPDGTTNQEIDIEVLNVGGNIMSSSKHVGSGKINLLEILAAPQKETDLTINLTFNKKKEKGLVTLHAKVIEDIPPPEKNKEPETEPIAKKEEPKEEKKKEETKAVKNEEKNKEEPKEVHEKNKDKQNADKEEEKNKEEKEEKVVPNKPQEAPMPSSKAVVNDPPVEKSNEEGAVANTTPFEFEKALLCIRKISANNLKNVEKFGKNDPYVQFHFGKWKSTTDTHDDAGADSEWLVSPQDHSMQVEVTPAALHSTPLEVVVMEQNDVFSDSLIGNTKVDLSFLLVGNDFDREKSITCKLLSKNGKKETGTVTLVFILKSIVDEPKEEPKDETVKAGKEEITPNIVKDDKMDKKNNVKENEVVQKAKEVETPPSSTSGADNLPLDFATASLQITKIEAKNLKDVEGFMGGKNDPYVKLSFGELWSGQTTEKDEAGSEAVWDSPKDACLADMHFKVKPAELRALKMNVTAMDKNIKIRDDSFIGNGENYLHTALNQQYGENCVVKFQLKDGKTNKAGEIYVHFKLEKNEVSPPSENKKDVTSAKKDIDETDGKSVEPFTSGTIEIHTIKCVNLKNVEIIGKNDPYVKLAFSGSEWVDATLPLQDVDTPVWKDLDMDIEVSADMIEEDRISVEVWDENSMMKDKFIGRGDTPVHRLLQSLDSQKPIDLLIPLLDDKKKKVGEAIIYATLKRYVEKKTMITEVDEAYTNGSLIIERIRAKNLLNTEMLGAGKQDPYVVLKLLDKADLQTSFKDNGGSMVVWNSLDLRFTEVSRDVMQNEKLLVEVWDDNGMLSNKLIGTGAVSIASAGGQLGQTVELEVDLETKKGGVAGKVVLDVKAQEGVEESAAEDINYEISEGFTKGLVRIKKIAVFDAANTEMIGAGQQDLYTRLSFKDWTEDTAVQDDVGSDAVWDNLDMNFDVTAESLKNDFLSVQLFDDNLMTDTLIGSQEKVSLMPAAASVGEVVEIKVTLPADKKGKSKGRLILYVEVCEHAIEEKFNVSESFTSGCIHIEKICAYNLNGTTKNKKMTPSVKVIFEEFEATTEMSSGVSPVWDFLSMKPPVTRDQLVNSKLIVEVFNRKKLIGTGQVSVAKAGASINELVELRVEILDKDKAPFSYAIINMSVKEESPDAAISAPKTNKEEEVTPPPGFLQGLIYITSVKSFGLKNPDFFGKADPYVEVLFESKLGNSSEKTPVYTNAGEQVVWDDVKLKVPISADDILANKKVKVKAWDENSGKDTHTGSGEFSMRKLVKGFGKEITLNIDLVDDKGKRAGRLVMVAELRESEPEPEVFLPKDFTAGILKVIQICTFDLKNLEMFGAGKQDPYCKVRAGDFFEEKTFEKENGGSDVVWDYLDMSIPVTAEFLTSDENYLELEAWESNLIKDDMIGKGEVSLKKVVTIGEEVELLVPLRNDKQESTGRLSVLVRLENLPPKEVTISPDFHEGTLSIRRIVAHGLANKEWFGKADPYVRLVLAEWESKTNALTNQGSNVMWDFLDMKTVVTLDMLKAKDEKRHTIMAMVMDKNSVSKDKLIGVGEVKISKAFTTLGAEVELSVDLEDNKKKPTGRLVLFVTATEGIEPDECDLKVSPGFEFGTLNVGKIRSFDLKNTEIFGLQDPFVELQVGGWEGKTFTKDDGGGDVLWDFLDLSCDVTAEMLQSEKMFVTVWDENKGLKNALIGRGECSLIKPGAHVGTEVEVAVSLKDQKGKDSGRLVLYLTLQDEEVLQEGSIPESFTRGELHVQRINGFSLKNTELIGKQDPYVVLKLGDALDIKTKVLDNAGSNPSWKNLDFKAILPATAVKVQDLEVEVWDKNTTSDTLIGTGHVSLRPAAASIALGTTVELRVILTTKTGKNAGRINIGVRMKELPPEALEKEVILPETFKSGIVHFHKIIAKGLQNKEFAGGKQDPYVKLEVAGWTNRTKTLQNAGSNAIWSDIQGLFTEVDRRILADCKLKVTVMDENSLTSHSLLGSGSISLRKLAPKINSPVELSIDLSEKGVSCGRLEVHATLREALPEEIVDTVDESLITLSRGALTVKQVETIEILGGDSSLLDNKQDQYVVVELQRWSWKSPVQDNVGASAIWKDLKGVATDVHGDVLKQEYLKVTVFDKNSVMTDTFIGEGRAPLRKAGSCLDQDIAIRMRLMDKHNMPVGTAVVTVQVNAHTQKTEENGDQSLSDARQLPKFGFLEFTEISAKNLKNTEYFGKQDPYAIISLGTNFKIQTDVLKDAGSNPVWKQELAKKVVSAQLSRDKLKITVMHQNKKKGDLLGEGFVTAIPLLAKMNEWVELTHDLMCNHKPAGSFTLKCKYRPADEDEQEEHEELKKKNQLERIEKLQAARNAEDSANRAKEIDALNTVIKDMKASQKDLLKRLGGMENSISKQLQEELAGERKRLASMLSKQSERIDKSLDKISLGKKKEEESPLPWHGMTMTELQNISLPRNVYDWRAAHIQAWISLRLDLPQYIQAFHDASIDGIVLLKFVDEDVLKDSLGVAIPLHRHKIMAGIASLRDNMDEFERNKEEKRREAARQAAEDEAARLAAVQQSPKKKKKKKKASQKPTAATWFGDVREHNDLERVKLERIMREKRAQQSKAKTQHNNRSGVWKFEYTGGARPVDPSEEVWTDPHASGNNTITYEKNMKDLFRSDLTATMPSVRAYSGKLRVVPNDSVFDEVLAITRAAMFDVSNRLVEIEIINDQKEMELNSDLENLGGGDETHPESTSNNLTLNMTDICEEGEKGYGGDTNGDLEGEESELGPPPPFDDTFDDTEDLGTMVTVMYPDSDPATSTNAGRALDSVLGMDRGTIDHVDAIIASKKKEQQKKYDRTGLIYDAFVSQKNNDAKWLGSNDKLTRLKFYGGFETILRLKCPWPQFDVLWNKLDSVRSGELDKNEFKAFFGDFSEFEASGEGTSNNADFGNLAKIMYDLCTALRTAGFTVLEIFSSFDRNGSGEVSVSEFCSMLRVVLGKRVDKKQVFRSFALMDVDSSRSISCNEVLMLVYNVWKSQMRELADRLASLDEEYDSQLIRKVLAERNLIKEAVKKNFPREWRDRMERTGKTYSSGPFGSLLNTLNVTTTTPSPEKSQTFGTTNRSALPSPPSGWAQQGREPHPPLGTKLSQSAKAGRNEMMRYKINSSRSYTPTREGAVLQMPHTTNLGAASITTEGSTIQRLQQTEPAGNKVFTLTS